MRIDKYNRIYRRTVHMPRKAAESKEPIKPKTSLAKNISMPLTKASPALAHHTSSSEGHSKTKIIVKYNCGWQNALYLRGIGANLQWDKGTPLKNVRADEWMWETDQPFQTCEFKIVLNDKNYEEGENHRLQCGKTIFFT